jgi:hypothetical protein
MDLTMPQAIIGVLVLALGPGGAAYVGVKLSLNGIREDVHEIKGDVKELRLSQQRHSERLTKVETKMEGL